LVKLWLLQEFGRHWATEDLQLRISTWSDAQADAIVECEEWKSTSPAVGTTVEEMEEARLKYVPVPLAEPDETREETVICFVGDSGTNDANAEAVAAAITLDDPDLVVIAGDAVYQPLTPAQAFTPYQAFIDAGRLVVALGNHDLDLNDGADVSAYVSNPGNGRYFNVAVGPVEVFVANSGINTAGAGVEPDGNFAGSIQWTTLTGLIERSCAPWKFAVLHHAPYSSGDRYWPGVSSMRWASDLPVHGVIAGHSHNYERGTFRGRKHFVVGTGGRALDGFVSPLTGSEERLEEFGYLRLTASTTTALLEFIGTNGTVLDTVTITGDAPVVSTEPTEFTMTTYNDTIEAGTDYYLDVFIRNENGAAVDVSACTAEIQLKRTLSDPAALTLTMGSGISIIDGPGGHFQIHITDVQTSALVDGTYIYAMETYCPATSRPLEGIFTVTPEVVT
jgi:hypothetical protein